MRVDLDTIPARSIPLDAIGSTRNTSNGETPRLIVKIRNGSGQHSDMFLNPPLLAEANVYKGDDLVFTGIVRLVSFGATIELEIER